MEEIGVIRRMIQDVLVPEMQGIKERLATHEGKFISIEKRLDRIDARLDRLESEMRQGFDALRAGMERLGTAIDRIEARLSISELDKRLLRLEILQDRGSAGPKSSAA